MNLELVRDLLEATGFVVVHAPTAEEALAVIPHCRPDLVLMDFALPGMHGMDAVRILKTNPATCRIPVVALTASAMKTDEENAAAAGCDGYLAKPICARAFLKLIESFLGRSAGEMAPAFDSDGRGNTGM